MTSTPPRPSRTAPILWVILTVSVFTLLLLPASLRSETLPAATPSPVTPAVSPAPAAPDPEYLTTSWGVEQGLPQHVVSAVMQTAGGDLWVATYHGLARFDGVRFTIFDRHSDPPLTGRGVTVLRETTGGGLLAGLENGAIHSFENQLPMPAPVRPPRPEGSVRSLAGDAAGDSWALWKDGLLERLRDGLRLPLGPEIDPSEAELELLSDSARHLYLIHRTGIAEVTAGGVRPLTSGLNTATDRVQRAATAASGGLWLVAGSKLWRWHPDKPIADHGAWPSGTLPPERSYVSSLLELRDGRLLFGLVEGGAIIGRPGGPWQIYDRRAGLPHNWVRCLAEDHEGNLWLGTGGGGLVALRPRRVRMVEVADDQSLHTVQSLSPTPAGALWTATEGGGLYLMDGNSRQNFRTESGLKSPYLWTVLQTLPDEIWTGSWNGGLFVRKGAGLFGPAPGWPASSPPVKMLFRTEDGSLWVGGGGPLARRDGSTGSWSWQDPQGLPWAPPEQQSITGDTRGGLWIGMGNGDLLHRTRDSLTTFSKADGLPGDGIIALSVEDPGTVWAGTAGGGLVRWREGRIAVLTTHHGLPGRMISQLLPDGRGFLWAGTYQGICRLDLAQLHACADGLIPRVDPLLLQRPDGLASLECTNGGQPGACRTPDGRLWFPTSRGLAVVQPDRILSNPLPPPVRVESILADTLPPAPAPAGPLSLPPGTDRLAIAYTALSFTAPDRVRFRTRLIGLETAWQEAGPERLATYRYLPPGRYEFQVMAANNDGVWNPKPATLRFKLQPRWYQRPTLQLLTAVSAAAILTFLVWAAARRRNTARLERLERTHALERERARIARDIHDDLGSGLTRIMLLSESARGELPADSPAAQEIESIRAAAGTLTQTMDEIVWAVDPRHDSLDSLVTYIGGTAQEYLRAAGLRFRLEAPDHPPAWTLSADCRHSLFLAFREALTNVIRHARAKTVRVIFTIQPHAFTLTLEDDGSGFDPAHPSTRPQGGRGLTHMRDRLTELGGHCEIHSHPGGGTRITFHLPVPASASALS